MKSRFLETVCRSAHDSHLWGRGDRILAAVSGGPDSLGLLLALKELAEGEGLTVGCCCVDHHLRPGSGQEAAYVQTVCDGLDIPCYIKEINVRKARAEAGGSLETAARTLRYEALRQVMKEGGWMLLATAHHADDQAETVLHHILRGSGLTGLRGMLPKNGDIIRPFLSVRKTDISQFLKGYSVTPCHDESNDVPSCTRNRIRLELIPQLETYNPEITEALCRMAETVREDELCLDRAAQKLMESAICDKGTILCLEVTAFREMLPAMQRRVIRKIFQKISGEAHTPDFQTAERFCRLLNEGHTGQCTSGGGVLVTVQYGVAQFQSGSTRDKRKEVAEISKDKTEDRGDFMQMGPWVMTQEYMDIPPDVLMENQCLLDADKVDGVVTLRGRRSGDWFSPMGMEGSASLKKWMIDRKIPKEERDAWPLAADDRQIYWVCGLRKSRLAMPDEKTKHYLLLTVRRV